MRMQEMGRKQRHDTSGACKRPYSSFSFKQYSPFHILFHPFTDSSIYPSIHSSIHLFIHPFIHPSRQLSICLLIYIMFIIIVPSARRYLFFKELYNFFGRKWSQVCEETHVVKNETKFVSKN